MGGNSAARNLQYGTISSGSTTRSSVLPSLHRRIKFLPSQSSDSSQLGMLDPRSAEVRCIAKKVYCQ